MPLWKTVFVPRAENRCKLQTRDAGRNAAGDGRLQPRLVQAGCRCTVRALRRLVARQRADHCAARRGDGTRKPGAIRDGTPTVLELGRSYLLRASGVATIAYVHGRVQEGTRRREAS